MKKTVLLFLLSFTLHAFANPALHGTWSAAVEGQSLVVVFEAGGRGKVNDVPMQWQALGPLLAIQQQGQDAVAYTYKVEGSRLSISGGDLATTVVLSRGNKPVVPAKAGTPSPARSAQELVGTWCKMSTLTTNSGGSQRSTCFELRADGTYTYQHQGSMSAQAPGMWGGTSSQGTDAGRWSVRGNQLTAQSQRGTVNTYTLEKRNHPKNKRDPMICLDGECYVTLYNRAPW